MGELCCGRKSETETTQLELAEMLDTTISYIGGIEPFRLFVDDKNWIDDDTLEADDYLERLTTQERQDLTKRIIDRISNGVERILQSETEK